MTKKRNQRYSSEFKTLALRRASEDGVTNKEVCEDPSDIYQRPDADPDNTKYINAHAPILYARLDDYSSLQESIENRWVP